MTGMVPCLNCGTKHPSTWRCGSGIAMVSLLLKDLLGTGLKDWPLHQSQHFVSDLNTMSVSG